MKYILMLFMVISIQLFADTKDEKIEKKLNSLEKPLYTPFVENYILHELKQLRDENRNLKIELHNTLAKKEVEISNNAINYATSTINNMFYILAAATSLLVIVGWNSMRDINEKVKGIVDEKVSNIIREYENRMSLIEDDLAKRAKQVVRNQQAIEETNVIHSLWMRASQETTLNGKIEIYNEILEIRPDDVEAIIYKADTVLEMGESNWALTLTNQALSIDDNYADAYYQRAKVLSVLGLYENSIDDLQKAIELNEQYIFELKNEKVFKDIISNEKIEILLKDLESKNIES